MISSYNTDDDGGHPKLKNAKRSKIADISEISMDKHYFKDANFNILEENSIENILENIIRPIPNFKSEIYSLLQMSNIERLFDSFEYIQIRHIRENEFESRCINEPFYKQAKIPDVKVPWDKSTDRKVYITKVSIECSSIRYDVDPKIESEQKIVCDSRDKAREVTGQMRSIGTPMPVITNVNSYADISNTCSEPTTFYIYRVSTFIRTNEVSMLDFTRGVRWYKMFYNSAPAIPEMGYSFPGQMSNFYNPNMYINNSTLKKWASIIPKGWRIEEYVYVGTTEPTLFIYKRGQSALFDNVFQIILTSHNESDIENCIMDGM